MPLRRWQLCDSHPSHFQCLDQMNPEVEPKIASHLRITVGITPPQASNNVQDLWQCSLPKVLHYLGIITDYKSQNIRIMGRNNERLTVRFDQVNPELELGVAFYSCPQRLLIQMQWAYNLLGAWNAHIRMVQELTAMVKSPPVIWILKYFQYHFIGLYLCWIYDISMVCNGNLLP